MIKDSQQFNETIKPNSAFLTELRHKLPEFFTADKLDEKGNLVEESKFDIIKFKETLKEQNVNELTSGYQLDFIGKNYAKKQVGERATTVIVPDNEHNEKTENKDSKNLFFTGDNLDVLRHLQQNYANTVDFIYIDPPYNTGSDGFVYPDNFEYTDEQLVNMFGLNEEELSRLKSIQGKASHSAWLTFMYPRLYLAKKVLKETGVIFISIDSNEQANLKLIMDDVFGEGSKFPTFVWQNKQGGGNDSIHIAEETEYIFGYAKNLIMVNSWFERYDDEYIKRYKERDDKGKFFWDTFKRKSGKQYYAITTPDGTVLENDEYGNPISWLRSEKRFYEDLEAGEVKFVKNNKGKWTIHFKQRLPQGKKPRNIISKHGTTSTGSSEILNMFNSNIFSNPKPSSLIKYLIETTTTKDSLVFDFFAGSATTADAVIQLNAEDNGNRRYMMVQLSEPTKPDSPAYKAGYTTIDQISRARIEKAAEKIKSENPLLTEKQDFGFKHFQVVEANQQALDKIEYSDDIQLDMFDDMISLFSSDSLDVKGNATGFDTILQTYLTSDNYKFDVPIKLLDFAGIQIPYVNNQRMYIITNDWKAENTKVLVNAIGTNDISIQTIVVYGYTMEMESLRELEIALNQLETKVNLLVRY